MLRRSRGLFITLIRFWGAMRLGNVLVGRSTKSQIDLRNYNLLRKLVLVFFVGWVVDANTLMATNMAMSINILAEPTLQNRASFS